MKTIAVLSAAAMLGALASTGADAGWRGYGYGYAPPTAYGYSETRYGGYRGAGFDIDDDDDVPAYRTRRVVREVYEYGPRHRGYSWGGPRHHDVDLDDEE